MLKIDREVDRFLTLLRTLMRDRGFTQMEVQQALGWGRSYISQLFTKQKALRFEPVLLILEVIGVSPEAFFAEIYPKHHRHRVSIAPGHHRHRHCQSSRLQIPEQSYAA